MYFKTVYDWYFHYQTFNDIIDCTGILHNTVLNVLLCFIKYASIFKNTHLFLAAHYYSVTIMLNCKEKYPKKFKAIKIAKVALIGVVPLNFCV